MEIVIIEHYPTSDLQSKKVTKATGSFKKRKKFFFESQYNGNILKASCGK